MAAFTGVLTPNITTGIPGNRAAWLAAQTILVTTPAGHLGSLPPGSGTLTQVPPDYAESNYNGVLGGGYADIFYNRILLEPSDIDLGNLVSSQSRTITVFNGYFSNQTLQTITASGNDGLTLTGDLAPPDVPYGILEERTYTLAIDADGPPSVDAAYNFNFQGLDQVRLTVVGSRIVVMPYYVNAPATERLQWLTNTIVSRNGTEQRISLRGKPRQSFSMSAFISPNELNRADNLLYGWREQFWALPVWSECRVPSPVTVGDNVINVDTRYGDFRASSLAIIWKSPREFDVFEIQSLTTNTITLDRGVNDTYINASLAPVRIARLAADPRRLTTGFRGRIETNFNVSDNPSYIPKVTPANEQYNGIAVYLEGPLLNREYVEDVYTQNIEVVDYQTGPIEVFSPWVNTKIDRQFALLFDGLQEVWEFKSFLAARKGKRVPFYMPTFENNLRIRGTGTLGTPIEVESDEIAGQGSTRTTIAVSLLDGTWLFRTIVGSSIDSSGNTQVSLNIPLNVDAATIDFISFMGLKRLTSDQIEITWAPNNVANVVVPITEITP